MPRVSWKVGRRARRQGLSCPQCLRGCYTLQFVALVLLVALWVALREQGVAPVTMHSEWHADDTTQVASRAPQTAQMTQTPQTPQTPPVRTRQWEWPQPEGRALDGSGQRDQRPSLPSIDSSATARARRPSPHMSSSRSSNTARLHPVPRERLADVSSLKPWYGAGAANDDKYPDLWVQSAALLSKQLSDLVHYPDKKGLLFSVRKANALNVSAAAARDLKALFDARGSDKGKEKSQLHLLYAHIIGALGGENVPLRILEIGIGSRAPELVSSMAVFEQSQPGASLRAFRDYLPRSQICGADIDASVMFTEARITTHVVDQLNASSFSALYSACGSQVCDRPCEPKADKMAHPRSDCLVRSYLTW